ncbi:MAG: 7TM diverse intracellular signaling domain-containing protein [Candidatus Thermochlorobacter sp.]
MRYMCCVTLICAPILFSPALHAQSVIVLDSLHDEYPIGRYLWLYEDKSATLTIDSVISSNHASKFFASQEESPNFGYTSSVYWARFSVVSQNPNMPYWYLEFAYPMFDRIELYVPDSADTTAFTVKRAGDALPFEEREIAYRHYVFSLPNCTDTMTYFLRLQTQSSMSIPLKIWTPASFKDKTIAELFALGLYYGIFLVMVFYNAFLAVSLRDKSYAFYVLYVLGFGIFQLTWNGLAYQFLWPNAVWWNNLAPAFFIAFAGFWVANFSRSFLNLKKFLPAIDKLLIALTLFCVVAMGLSMLLPYIHAIRLVYAVPLTLLPIVIPAAVFCLRKGFRPAGYFLMAWTLFLLTSVFAVLRNLGFMPTNFFTIYGTQIGSALEVILLSLGLADRINSLRIEKEKSEAEAKLREMANQFVIESSIREAEIERLKNVELANALIQVEQQKNIAQKANAFKTELLGIAAHDLKNPLQSIMGFAELIREKAASDSNISQMAAAISASSKRMSKLITDLLQTAALDSGQLTLQKEKIALSQLLASVVENNRTSAACKQQTLELICTQNCILEVDVERMHEVLDNLISNAIKYSPQGKHIIVRSEVKHYVEKGDTASFAAVRIAIQDEGQGLSEEDMKKLFGRFQRLSARPTGNESSTGLGLSIVKQLVELHGGKVWAESEGRGKGTTFFVELPIEHS